MYSGSVLNLYAEMVATVCPFITALVFLLFHPYKDNWLNIWDSTVFSLITFAQFWTIYARYLAPLPMTFEAVMILTVPLIYLTIYATYKLLTWTKALQMCRKRTKDSTLEPQEPDRLLHPEEYGSEEHKPLLAPCEGDNCGNSQKPNYRTIALWHNV